MSAFDRFFRKHTADSGEPMDRMLEPEARNLPAKTSVAPKRSWLSRLRPGARREQQLATLQQGYQELVGLIGAVRDQLEKQNHVQEKLVGYLDHVPEVVDGLKHVAVCTEQQARVLQQFDRTLTTMEESSRGSAQTIAGLVESARASEDLMRDMLERSERRLVMMVSVLCLATLVVLGGSVYLGLAGVPDGLRRWIDQVRHAAPATVEPAMPGRPDVSDMPDESGADSELPEAVPPEIPPPAEHGADTGLI